MFSKDTREMESILSITNSQKIIVRAESISRFLGVSWRAVKLLSKEEVFIAWNDSPGNCFLVKELFSRID